MSLDRDLIDKGLRVKSIVLLPRTNDDLIVALLLFATYTTVIYELTLSIRYSKLESHSDGRKRVIGVQRPLLVARGKP